MFHSFHCFISGIYSQFISCVLVSLSYYNRLSLTEWLIDNKNLFLTVLGAGKSRIKSLGDYVSGESTSWFIDGSKSSCCVLTWLKWMKKLSGVPFTRTFNSIHKDSTLMTFTKLHLLTPSHWQLWFQYKNGWGT